MQKVFFMSSYNFSPLYSIIQILYYIKNIFRKKKFKEAFVSWAW